MKVLVDTCVWSMALRRSDASDGPEVSELMELIKELRVQLIGPVRQEILSGIRSIDQFTKLRDHLRPFPDLELTSGDFESAAELCNLCRGKGVQGSNTDFLMCAVAVRHQMPIFTTDVDFSFLQQHLPIKLYRSRLAPWSYQAQQRRWTDSRWNRRRHPHTHPNTVTQAFLHGPGSLQLSGQWSRPGS